MNNYSTPFNEFLTKDNSCPYSFRISKQDKLTFQKAYPYCMSRFIKKAIKLAIQDKNFFDTVYFGGI